MGHGWGYDGCDFIYILTYYHSRIHPTVLGTHEMSTYSKLLKLLRKIAPTMEERRKNFFARARTSEKVDKDGKKILVVEEIDDPDYRYGDFRDEINDVERIRKSRKE